MSGYIKDENSLANGIPNRTISPETGSFGNATMTNKGDTSEGVNQDHEARPAPAAGFDSPQLETNDLGEHRSFSPQATGSAGLAADSDLESPAQQIADGDDQFKHGKRFSDEDKHGHGHKETFSKKSDREGLSDDSLGKPLSDDTLGR